MTRRHGKDPRSLSMEHAAGRILLFLVASMPLLFGATHPVVQGVYTAILLTLCGGWVLLIQEDEAAVSFILWSFLTVALYTLLITVPFPVAALAYLDPVRARRAEAILSLAGAEAVRTAPISYAPRQTIPAMGFMLGLLVYYASVKPFLRSGKFRHALLSVMAAVGFSEALYGLLQALQPSMGVLWLPGDIGAGMARGTIIYRNQYAAFLNLCWPPVLALGFMRLRDSGGDTGPRVKGHPSFLSDGLFSGPLLPGFIAGVMMLAVVFSQSRGGILSMCLVFGLLFASLPFTRKNKVIVWCCVAAIILFYGRQIGFEGVEGRFSRVMEEGATRIAIWRESMAMIKDHPFTGIGPGAYAYLSPIYLKGFQEGVLYDHAHNEYLEIAIEYGIPVALSLFIWLTWGMIRSAKDLLRHDGRSDEKVVLALAAFCALAGFLSQGAVDFVWRLPANALYGVTLAALMSTGHESILNKCG